MIITTPNWNSLERILFQNDWKAIDPQHYHYFTKNTIINSLNKSKLVLVELKTRNFNPFQKKPKSGKKILKDQKVTATKLRSISSKGMGFIVKKFLNLILNTFSLGSTLAKVLQIDGKSYTMKKDDNKKQKIGVLAQDIEKVFPELVSESNGVKSVNYQGLVPVLINALKEQQTEIDIYRDEVLELKEMVQELLLRK